MYNVGALLAQAANTHSHPPTCIVSLSLLCRHTDMANLIALLSPRVSFSTGAFQLLPEPASIYSGREEQSRGRPGRAGAGPGWAGRLPLTLSSRQPDTAENKQLAHWVSCLPLSADTELWAPRPASIWAHSVKYRQHEETRTSITSAVCSSSVCVWRFSLLITCWR